MKRQFWVRSTLAVTLISSVLVSCRSTGTLDIAQRLENLPDEEKAEAYEKAVKDNPAPELLYNKAYHELERREYSKALETAGKALDENPEFIRMEFLEMLTYREIGNTEKYISSLEDIAGKLPYDKEIISLLLSEYIDRRNYLGMVETAKQLLTLDPIDSNAINALAFESDYMKAISGVFPLDDVIEKIPEIRTSSRIKEDEMMEKLRERFLLPFLFVTD